jgi:threonine dehydratase
MPTLADIEAARHRLAGGVAVTACTESVPLSALAGSRVYCKRDYLQATGSFKERGARNALLLLEPARRARGVIAASAGNHALGLAYHGQQLDIPVTVVMPINAPLIKVATCRRFGARVLLEGESFEAARRHADKLAAGDNLTYIHGFDDPAVIAGQGTVGLEILEQVPEVDAIVLPVGGGGLIAGVAVAVKALRPQVQVLGVEAAHAPSFTAALAAGEPIDTDTQPTLADGLGVSRVGRLAFELAHTRIDDMTTVDEEALALAVFRLMELEKCIVEGAAAAALAALLCQRFSQLKGKRVVLVLAGGNIDLTILDRIIEVGLVADGRLCRFTAIISDRPGGLAKLAAVIAATGASIKEITHDRIFSGPDVSRVRVVCVAETTDRSHIDRLHQALADAGIDIAPDAA